MFVLLFQFQFQLQFQFRFQFRFQYGQGSTASPRRPGGRDAAPSRLFPEYPAQYPEIPIAKLPVWGAIAAAKQNTPLEVSARERKFRRGGFIFVPPPGSQVPRDCATPAKAEAKPRRRTMMGDLPSLLT